MDNTGQPSEGLGKLYAALAKAQGAMVAAKKDVSNTFFKSKYADLASVMEVARKPLSDNELAVIQTLLEDDKGLVRLVTTLGHSSGQEISSLLVMQPKDSTPQSFGSCVTYARRYGYSALVGVCSEEDDDGNAASGRNDRDFRIPTNHPPPDRQATHQPRPAAPTPPPVVQPPPVVPPAPKVKLPGEFQMASRAVCAKFIEDFYKGNRSEMMELVTYFVPDAKGVAALDDKGLNSLRLGLAIFCENGGDLFACGNWWTQTMASPMDITFREPAHQIVAWEKLTGKTTGAVAAPPKKECPF